MKLYEYEINGIKLNIDQLQKISAFYEASLVAEFIKEEYKDLVKKYTDDQLIKIGYESRIHLYDSEEFSEAERNSIVRTFREYNITN